MVGGVTLGPTASEVLMVILRFPQKGAVMTRLAREIGEDKALEVYQALLRYTWAVVADVTRERGASVSIFVTSGGEPVKARPDLMALDMGFNEDWEVHQQSSGDLGARLMDAFRTALKDGERKALIIGVDCIGLDLGILDDAFRSMQDNDIIIGPTEDGGYYLIGMREPHDVFSGIAWGTGTVYDETMAMIEKRGLSVKVLPELYDVDTKKDWERACKEDPRIRKSVEAHYDKRGGAT